MLPEQDDQGTQAQRLWMLFKMAKTKEGEPEDQEMNSETRNDQEHATAFIIKGRWWQWQKRIWEKKKKNQWFTKQSKEKFKNKDKNIIHY